MKNIVFSIYTENEARLPYYISGVAINQSLDHIIRTTGYPSYQWIQPRSGSGTIVLEDKEYQVSEGQGIFLLPGVTHEYYPETDEWLVDWVGLTGTETGEFLKNIAGLTRSGVYHLADVQPLQQVMTEMVQTGQALDPLRNLDLSALAYTFLIKLHQQVSVSANTGLVPRYGRLKPVLDYIDNHYAEAITLKDLANLLSVTPQHLCTLFRKIMNTRIFEYINLVRIKKSKEFLLDQPALPIRDVAHSNGFEDVSYFCYIFKRIEKSTPGDFRKMHVRA